MIYISMNNRTRTTVSRNRARITRNRTNPAYIRKWMTQIHGIRFLPKTPVGRIQYAPYTGTKTIRAGLRRSFSTENVCGAYAVAPYTGMKMVRAGLRHSFSAENVGGAYAIRPYTGTKMVRVGLRRS